MLLGVRFVLLALPVLVVAALAVALLENRVIRCRKVPCYYTRDKDVIQSSRGFDLIYVNDGDTRDKISGGKGNDKCYVDTRSEVGGGCSRVRAR